MSDTSVKKIKGIASYYKGTQEEILNIPVHLIDPDGIFVESNTGEMWTGIQIIKIKLDNEIEPVAEDEEVISQISKNVANSQEIENKI